MRYTGFRTKQPRRMCPAGQPSLILAACNPLQCPMPSSFRRQVLVPAKPLPAALMQQLAARQRRHQLATARRQRQQMDRTSCCPSAPTVACRSGCTISVCWWTCARRMRWAAAAAAALYKTKYIQFHILRCCCIPATAPHLGNFMCISSDIALLRKSIVLNTCTHLMVVRCSTMPDAV